MIDRLDLSLQHIGTWLKYVAAAILIGVALLIAVDVIARGLFNRPIIGVAEIVANGIVIIAYLQLTYTVRIGAMLSSELLISLIGRRGRIVLETIIASLGALFFGLMAWSSYTPLVRAISTGEFEGYASFQVPTWPVRMTIVVCSTLAVLTYATQAYRALRYGETLYDAARQPADAGPAQG